MPLADPAAGGSDTSERRARNRRPLPYVYVRMKTRSLLITFSSAALAAALLILTASRTVTEAAPPARPAYTSGGELVVPADYRSWIFLTSNINMGYPSEGTPPANMPTMFGNVFVDPEAYRSFVATGTWPDKTILMIENRGSGHTTALNPNSRFQTDLHGLEFHVKDSAHGGWTFYAARPGSASASPFATSRSCYACHEKNGAVDTTFVQYYPTLVDIAKKKGTYRATPE